MKVSTGPVYCARRIRSENVTATGVLTARRTLPSLGKLTNFYTITHGTLTDDPAGLGIASGTKSDSSCLDTV
jgi:hypothetical protein